MVDAARNSGWHFPFVRKSGLADSEGAFQLCLAKSYYPYERFATVKEMDEYLELPPREDFYSSVVGDTITEEQYAVAKKIWDKMGFRCFTDYCTFYVRLGKKVDFKCCCFKV